MAGNVKGGSSRNAQLIVVGGVLYLVAWFVPVWRSQELFGSLGSWLNLLGADKSAPGMSGPDWLPGWQACELGWELLVSEARGDEWWKQRFVGSSCLTNVVML